MITTQSHSTTDMRAEERFSGTVPADPEHESLVEYVARYNADHGWIRYEPVAGGTGEVLVDLTGAETCEIKACSGSDRCPVRVPESIRADLNDRGYRLQQ